MDSISLSNLLWQNKFTKKYFRGIFALDTLPRKAKQPTILISNSDRAHLPGIHWVGIYIPGKNAENQAPEFFDSYGREPTKPEFLDFLTSIETKKVLFNPMQIQSNGSSSCGQITCLYLLHKSKGKPLKSFLKLFSNDLNQNEIVVRKLFKKHFLDKKRVNLREKKGVGLEHDQTWSDMFRQLN